MQSQHKPVETKAIMMQKLNLIVVQSTQTFFQ